MTDIISTARAAGVHPLAMSEEYLGGLQRFAAVFQQEIERLTLNGIHSCHAECQRPVCRLTRDRNALLGALKEAADALEIASNGGGVNFYQYAREVRDAIKAVEGDGT